MPLPVSAVRPVRGVSWGNTSTMPRPVLDSSGAARGVSLGNPSTMPAAAPEVGCIRSLQYRFSIVRSPALSQAVWKQTLATRGSWYLQVIAQYYVKSVIFSLCNCKASSSDQLTFWPDESLSARREPQCPTKASVPDESKLELVQLAPRTAPRTAPHTTPRIRKLI